MNDVITDARFEFYIGDTYSRDFALSGWSLLVDEMFFSVKKNKDDKRYALQKTLNNGITLVSDEEGIKTYNILIDGPDTDGLKTEVEYPFDIKLNSTGADGRIIEKTVIEGVLVLKPHSTRFYNE